MDKKAVKLYLRKLRCEITDAVSHIEKLGQSSLKRVSFLQDDPICKSSDVNESFLIEEKTATKINPQLNEKDFTFDWENGALCNIGGLLDKIQIIE